MKSVFAARTGGVTGPIGLIVDDTADRGGSERTGMICAARGTADMSIGAMLGTVTFDRHGRATERGIWPVAARVGRTVANGGNFIGGDKPTRCCGNIIGATIEVPDRGAAEFRKFAISSRAGCAARIGTRGRSSPPSGHSTECTRGKGVAESGAVATLGCAGVIRIGRSMVVKLMAGARATGTETSGKLADKVAAITRCGRWPGRTRGRAQRASIARSSSCCFTSASSA